MPDYVLSRAARADLKRITQYSLKEWGLSRGAAYMEELEETFSRLAAFPALGREASHIRSGYHRLELGSHVVFYRQQGEDVLIIRILHERMDFLAHLP